MKQVNWNPEKAKQLKLTRGIDIELIAEMIEASECLAVIDVPSRLGQKMFLLDYDGYLVCVPFVENEKEIFIKTAYKNRKLNKSIKEKLT